MMEPLSWATGKPFGLSVDCCVTNYERGIADISVDASWSSCSELKDRTFITQGA